MYWKGQLNLAYLVVQKILQYHGSLELVDLWLRMCLVSLSICFYSSRLLCSVSELKPLAHILRRLRASQHCHHVPEPRQGLAPFSASLLVPQVLTLVTPLDCHGDFYMKSCP